MKSITPGYCMPPKFELGHIDKLHMLRIHIYWGAQRSQKEAIKLSNNFRAMLRSSRVLVLSLMSSIPAYKFLPTLCPLFYKILATPWVLIIIFFLDWTRGIIKKLTCTQSL